MNQYNKLLGLIRDTSKQKIQHAFSQLAKQRYHVTPTHTLLPSRLLLLQNPHKFRQPFTAYDFLGKRGYADIGFPGSNGVSNGGGSKKENRIINVAPNRGRDYGNFDRYGPDRCLDYSNLEGKVKDFLHRIKLVAEIVWLLLENVAFITIGISVALLSLMCVFAAYYALFFLNPSQEELELSEAKKKAKARKKRSKSN